MAIVKAAAKAVGDSFKRMGADFGARFMVTMEPYYIGGASSMPPGIQPSAVGAEFNSSLASVFESPGKKEYWEGLGSAWASTAGLGAEYENLMSGNALDNAINTWDSLVNETTTGWGDFFNTDGLASMSFEEGMRELANLQGRNDAAVAVEPIDMAANSKSTVLKYKEAYRQWRGNPDKPYVSLPGINAADEAGSQPDAFDRVVNAIDAFVDKISIGGGSGGGGPIETPQPNYHVSSDYRNWEAKDKPTEPTQEARRVLTDQLSFTRSKAIEYMLNSGPDFMKHMFDVMLICSSANDNEMTNFFSKIYSEKALFNQSVAEADQDQIFGRGGIFSLRTASVNVPQMESETFDVKHLFNTIKKVRTKVKFERKSELKLTMDEPMYFHGLFNMMSNNNMIKFNYLDSDNRKAYNFFAPYSTLRTIAEDAIRKVIRLDLLVVHKRFGADYYSETGTWAQKTKDIWRDDFLKSQPLDMETGESTTAEYVQNFAGLRNDELPLWWFEDIAFLGQGDDLVFKRDNDSVTQMTFPFIFKRVVKIDRQRRYGPEKQPGSDEQAVFFNETFQQTN
jgi:hypothetical protein